jgi:hypothetical protein
MPKLNADVRILFIRYLFSYSPENIRGFTVDSSQDLGCHIFTVPFTFKVACHLSWPGTGHTKVTNPESSLVRNKDICRLEIKMNESI